MTVAELQAYVGKPSRGGATYFCERAPFLVTAWEDDLDGEPGWWWALTRTIGEHEVVAAMGFRVGARRDRDIEIANAILRALGGGVSAEAN